MSVNFIKMNVYIRIKYYWYLLLTKIFVLINQSIYYENKYGIKNINKKIITNQDFVKKYVDDVDPNKLHINFDGLKDQYTLTGLPINETPHYDLMIALNNNSCIKRSNYYERLGLGILDERNSIFINRKSEKMMVSKFKKSKSEILQRKSSEIFVYELDGKLYIIDGKHRAALASVINKTVNCIVLDKKIVQDGFWFELYKQMRKNPSVFQKNINFMLKIINKEDL